MGFVLEYGGIICLRSEYVGSGDVASDKVCLVQYSSAVVYGELFLAGKLAAGATAVGCPAPAAFSETLTLQPHATSPSLHFSSLLSHSLSLPLPLVPVRRPRDFPAAVSAFHASDRGEHRRYKDAKQGLRQLCVRTRRNIDRYNVVRVRSGTTDRTTKSTNNIGVRLFIA